ncbi:MAG TPA: glutamine synthetase family protein [Thermoanaerobaculia bacterium]|nr:glutamine synthetase family protein [Thermoanaerobaculia bacterium]
MGGLTREELLNAIEEGSIETVLAVLPDWYGRLLGKRLTGRFFARQVAEQGWHACDYVLACDMEMDPVPGYAFTSWESGYGDMRCRPDWTTLCRAAWLPKTALVLCDPVRDTGEPIEVAPRRILTRQVDRAAQMGLLARGGAELELYLFKETYDSAREKHWHDLVPFGTYIEDYHLLAGTREEPVIGALVRALEKSGIPTEGSKGEWGPGQQEINVEYSDLVEQADRNVVTKHAAKEIAHEKGLAITFMAKWDERFAGSGLHQHISLWDPRGETNVFSGGKKLGGIECSDTFRFFLGGLLAHAAELTAFWAPSVNSYKRFQSASFAPTTIAWSVDNRTAGFRVVGEGRALRIECRIPGADSNPYVAWAATLAAGLAGVAGRVEPPPPFAGDVYAAKALPRVPGNLRDAIALLEASRLAKEAFGEEVVAHYLHFLRTEQRKFDEAVTSWERGRFFERG